jgi:hypothetical protein
VTTDLAGNALDPGLVLLGENVLLLAGEEDVGEGLADGVNDLAEVELLLAMRADDEDIVLMAIDIFAKRRAPVEIGFLFLGNRYETFESEIFLKIGGRHRPA